MTNVCVAKSFDKTKSEHTAWVLNEEATKARQEKELDGISDAEIQNMYKVADKIFAEDEYHRLRSKAIVSIADKNGNRRSEIASLEMNKVLQIPERSVLQLIFVLVKKRKRGQQQYRNFLSNQVKHGLLKYEDYQKMSVADIEKGWREWQNTIAGVSIKTPKSRKEVDLDSQAAKIILEYYNWMKINHPKSIYLFPKKQNGLRYKLFLL
jgi:hypothetical protein